MSPKLKAWLKGAVVAGISGGAAAASVVSVMTIHDLKALGVAFLVSFVASLVAYMAKSPLPVD